MNKWERLLIDFMAYNGYYLSNNNWLLNEEKYKFKVIDAADIIETMDVEIDSLLKDLKNEHKYYSVLYAPQNTCYDWAEYYKKHKGTKFCKEHKYEFDLCKMIAYRTDRINIGVIKKYQAAK